MPRGDLGDVVEDLVGVDEPTGRTTEVTSVEPGVAVKTLVWTTAHETHSPSAQEPLPSLPRRSRGYHRGTNLWSGTTEGPTPLPLRQGREVGKSRDLPV